MEMAGDYPDILVGCTGGGSNFSGLVFPFIGKNFREGKNTRVIACEPKSCPSLTKGKFVYDFGDTGNMTPLAKMHTLGSTFVPPGFHARFAAVSESIYSAIYSATTLRETELAFFLFLCHHRLLLAAVVSEVITGPKRRRTKWDRRQRDKDIY